MFLHNLKYECISTLRSNSLLLWLILFPVVLGTLFRVAFNSIYENDVCFKSIPTAVVETAENEVFAEVLKAVTESDDPLLSVTVTDEAAALKLLKNGEAKGVIYAGENVSLSVAGKGIQETILNSFVRQYGVYETVIKDTMKQNPQKLPAVIEALSADSAVCVRQSVTTGNPDQMIQYFYNLIAMVAIFGCISGLNFTTENQTNLSPLGARKSCSPAPKFISLSAGLTGKCMAQSVCMLVCVTFLAFVLKIDFGNRLLLVYGTAILGGILGVSLGFFIGSLSKLSFEIKNGILMTVSLVMCFLSGLMIGNMKAYFAEKAPWINRINPAAMISDCFYCLNLYSDFERFRTKILIILFDIVLFTVLGILFSRRKQYASI